MDNPQNYEDQRRDEIADEYFAPSYESCPPFVQPAIDYIVEIEGRLSAATGQDIRTEWLNRVLKEDGE